MSPIDIFISTGILPAFITAIVISIIINVVTTK